MTGYPGATVLVAGDPEFTALLAETFRVNRVNAHVVIPGRAPLLAATLERVEPDLILLAGYMDTVPDDVIAAYPVWAFHPSLLPRYRGGSAVKWQLHDNVADLGCTIYQLAPGKLDAGPIVVRRGLDPWFGESVGELYRDLRTLGCLAFVAAVRRFLDGSYTLTPQDEAAATWHPRLAPGQSPTEYLAHAAQQGPSAPA